MSPDLRRTQRCPLCGAVQPVSQRHCTICGATLSGEATPVQAMSPIGKGGRNAGPMRFDPARGDDDLYLGDLRGSMWRLLFGMGVMVALGIGAGAAWWVLHGPDRSDDPPVVEVEGLVTVTGAAQTENPGTTPTPPLPTATAPPTATARNLWPTASPTVTPMGLLPYATVTPVPPTPTTTPTPGPCYQTAGPGDTVYGMAARCGHRDMAIVDVILEMNDMKSPVELQINQTLEIPWPTPTPGGDPGTGTGAVTTPADTGSADTALNAFGTPDVLEALVAFKPTLRPGLAWHKVQVGETVMSIAWLYGTNLKTLSELNPEVPFLQCDFGSASGGENCSVMLYEGQEIRVPVPLPTTTPTPTPAGTLTPTPTATATFNAPFPLNPKNGAHFYADQRVTLRWGGTGTLGPDERYLVRVRDLDTGETYMAPVTETSYVLPGGWQPSDRNKHTMEWTISIARVNAQFEVVSEQFVTEASFFTWDSR